MQFILPYTKSRSQSGNIPNESIVGSEMENDESNEDEEDVDKSEESEMHTPNHPTQKPLEHLQESNNSAHMSPSLRRLPVKRKIQPNPPVDEMEKAVVGYLSQRNIQKPENSDLEFFKSIIPDVAALNLSQKRRFKVKMLQTLEDMSKEGNVPPGASLTIVQPASNTQPYQLNYSSNQLFDSTISDTPYIPNYCRRNDFTVNPSTGMLLHETDRPPNYMVGNTNGEKDASCTRYND